MDCSVAIQVLPMDAATDEETIRVVDAVIAEIQKYDVNPYVGPFETAIEGDYDTCMEVLKMCQLTAAKAGCGHVMTYAKINYRPQGEVLSTERKVGKYHTTDSAFAASGLAEGCGFVPTHSAEGEACSCGIDGSEQPAAAGEPGAEGKR